MKISRQRIEEARLEIGKPSQLPKTHELRTMMADLLAALDERDEMITKAREALVRLDNLGRRVQRETTGYLMGEIARQALKELGA